MAEIIPFLLFAALIGFVRLFLIGGIAMWAFRKFSVAAPAFAGFCVALGAALGVPRGVDLSDVRGADFAWVVGSVLALLLLWRWKVRPERADETGRSVG